MGSIPLLFALCCFEPCEPSLNFGPTQVEEFAYFACEAEARNQREEAAKRKRIAAARKRFCVAVEDEAGAAYWQDVFNKAHAVWDVWDDLVLAYSALAAPPEALSQPATFWLSSLLSKIGARRYYHGSFPTHIDVWKEPPEVVPLPN